jgi:hypothetical protein
LRCALLFSLCDVFGYGEEMEKACAGKALRDGIALPRHELAYHAYEGGGFVVSHLDALAFALVGESVLAIKLVALVFVAGIVVVGWKLCERFGGAARPVPSRCSPLSRPRACRPTRCSRWASTTKRISSSD